MRLDDDKAQDFLAHLNKHWRKENQGCPICGNRDWGIQPDVVELREFRGGKLWAPGEHSVIPLVTVFCRVCSYTILFNAFLVGAVEKDSLPREESQNG